MASVNEIERLADRDARLQAYRDLVAAEPRHSFAWSNLAVDLAGSGDWIEGRRAALTAARIDSGLRQTGPEPYRALLMIGEVELIEEVVATARHVVYRGVGKDRQPVLVRTLPDVTVGQATALYGHHEVMTRVRRVPHVVRALATAMGPEQRLYQVLEHVRGEILWNLFRVAALGPDRAAALVADTARALEGARAAEIESFDLRPEFLLRADDPGVGVVSLGPLERRGDVLWLAPEERGGAGGPASDVFRLGLLLHASSGGELPTPNMSGDRAFDSPETWRTFPRLAETVAQATNRDATARPSPAAFADAVADAVSSVPSTSDDGKARRVAGLRLVRLLGTGRFAQVWEGEDELGKRSAVKILLPHIAADGELRLRFLNEAKIAGAIDHPGVIKVSGTGVTDEGEHYLVMELASGGTLDDVLATGKLETMTAADVGIQTADAMAAVHARTVDGMSIIHRDLKPSNLMIAERAKDHLTVKVSDFGVAKLAGEPTEAGVPMTRTGRLLGTPQYMAPEQWMMIDDLDPRADVYGLGAVLYHCLTGAPPFTGKNDYELQQAHLHKPPPPLAARGVPPGLARIVERMLAKDRNDRYPDMAAVAAALRAWREEERAKAAAPPKPPDPPPKPPAPPPEPPRPSFWKTPSGRALMIGAPLAIAVGAIAIVARPKPSPHEAAIDAGSIDPPIDAPAWTPPPDIDADVTAGPCDRLLFLEWAPVKNCGSGKPHEVWLFDRSNGACLRKLYDVGELADEVAAIAQSPAAPDEFKSLPAGVSIHDTGKLELVDGSGNLVGGGPKALLVFVSYILGGSEADRAGGITIEHSAPVFLSTTGYWCTGGNVMITPAVKSP